MIPPEINPLVSTKSKHAITCLFEPQSLGLREAIGRSSTGKAFSLERVFMIAVNSVVLRLTIHQDSW